MQQQKVTLGQVFNFKNPDARTRCLLLISVALESVITYITTGIFWTEFLRSYHMEPEEIGILAFSPFIASLFVIFAPSLLTRFKKRRAVLAICKALYYVFSIFALTMLPRLVTDSVMLVICMSILQFIAYIFNIIAVSGYAAWHVKFLPEAVRPYYMTFNQFSAALFSGALMLLAAFFADQSESMSPAQLQFLEYVRHFGFILGILDVILLSLPREVDYPVIRSPKFRDIITIPMSNKKYMLGMVVVFAWQFSLYCHSTFLQVYLMDTVGITYFLYCFVVFLYPFFFPFSMKFWQNRIQKTSWLRALALALMIEAPLQILYGFIRPGLAPWLLTTLLMLVRLPQHFAGVGRNSIVANMQYINMPQVNRTCYTSFYQIVFNLGAAAGLLFGTVFVALSKNFQVPLFGYTYQGGIPWLIVFSGVLQLGIIAYILLMGKRLEPDPETSSEDEAKTEVEAIS